MVVCLTAIDCFSVVLAHSKAAWWEMGNHKTQKKSDMRVWLVKVK